MILHIYYTIPDREKQEKNNKEINYFGQLLKNTFYEIINVGVLENAKKANLSFLMYSSLNKLTNTFCWTATASAYVDFSKDYRINAMMTWVSSEVRKVPLTFEIDRSTVSPDVLRFCHQNDILRYFLIAIDLVKKSFPTLRDLQFQLEKDPETEDEWLSLEVTIQGEVDDILIYYDNYTRQKVSLIPWPKRDKIRLSYNIT